MISLELGYKWKNVNLIVKKWSSIYTKTQKAHPNKRNRYRSRLRILVWWSRFEMLFYKRILQMSSNHFRIIFNKNYSVCQPIKLDPFKLPIVWCYRILQLLELRILSPNTTTSKHLFYQDLNVNDWLQLHMRKQEQT